MNSNSNFTLTCYPFGMPMPGRNGAVSGGEYRYGFNGQEQEKEITGSKSHTSAEFWMYDSRLAHRWNLDPKPNPKFSYYHVFECNPILFSDPFGDKVRYSGATKKERNEIKKDVRKARFGDSQFRRDFRKMKRDERDTFVFDKTDPNNLNANATNPAQTVSSELRNYIDGNGSVPLDYRVGDGNRNDGTPEQIYLTYRTPNTEKIKVYGGGDGKVQHGISEVREKHTEKTYISGNIIIKNAGSNRTEDYGNDVITFYDGANRALIKEIVLPGDGQVIKNMIIPFNLPMATQIRVVISNPRAPGKDPGATGANIVIKSN